MIYSHKGTLRALPFLTGEIGEIVEVHKTERSKRGKRYQIIGYSRQSILSPRLAEDCGSSQPEFAAEWLRKMGKEELARQWEITNTLAERELFDRMCDIGTTILVTRLGKV